MEGSYCHVTRDGQEYKAPLELVRVVLKAAMANIIKRAALFGALDSIVDRRLCMDAEGTLFWIRCTTPEGNVETLIEPIDLPSRYLEKAEVH